MAEVTVFDDRVCELGEGPFYDERTDRMVWVDIMGQRVLWRGVSRPEYGEFPTPSHVGAVIPRAGDGLVLCLRDGPALATANGDQWTIEPLGTYVEGDREAGFVPPPDAPPLRANDAKVDPVGRLWTGTMAYDLRTPAGALYRLDPDRTVPRRMIGGVAISNGLGWSPDRSTMYYIDTPTRRVDAFDYDLSTGEATRRRVFAEIDRGSPDGLCVDADGGIWVAVWRGHAVRRYRPDGTLDRVVDVPTAQVTSCTFAGEGYRTLVITTAAQDRPDDPRAGLTYAYVPGDAHGVPVDRFGG
jgi:sugar lactone lactonase YvrE